MLNDTQISAFRSRFPILAEKTYLYSCSQGALSDAVQSGMDAYARSWRTSTAPWDEWMGEYDAMRREFARFINADPSEVAIVTSASAGINPIANALQFGNRRRVVMSEYEFPTMGQIWLAQQARGAEVRFIDGVNNAVPLDLYDQAIDERTLIVPVTQVSFINGFRPDTAAIVRLAHERGALVFLDGYQDCGTRPLDVKALEVDFFVTGTLKYLLGPPGLAFLYVRKELIESLTPPITSWMAQKETFAFRTKCLDPASDARRFEGGSPPVPSIYAARPALQLLQSAGMSNVAARIEMLTQTFLRGARELGVATKTPADSVGPLVVVRSPDPNAVVQELSSRGILVSARQDGVRFSFHVYNTIDDVNAALGALGELIDWMAPA